MQEARAVAEFIASELRCKIVSGFAEIKREEGF
jgi:hypothetical protein